jgi:Tfp pilus assembly protein PilE
MKNSQKGFAPVLILIVIAVAAIGGGVYIVQKNKISTDQVQKGVSDLEDNQPQSDKKEDMGNQPILANEQNPEKKTTKTPEKTITTNTKVTTTAKTPVLYLADGATFPKQGPYIFLQGKSAKTHPIAIKVNSSSVIPTVKYGSKVTLSWNALGYEKCFLGGPVGIPFVKGGLLGDSNKSNQQLKAVDSIELYARVNNDFINPLSLTLDCSGGNGTNYVGVDATIAIPVSKPTVAFSFKTPTTGQVFTYQDKVNITWQSNQAVSSILTRLHRASDNHELNPENIRMPSLTGREIANLDWIVPAYVPPGRYYIKVYEINRLPVNYKSPVFTVKEPDVKKQGQYTYADFAAAVATTTMTSLKMQSIINEAYLEQNSSLCNSFTWEDKKYECIAGVAQSSGNVQMCFNIPADYKGFQNTRNSCFYIVAQRNYDPKICENIKDDQNGTIESCKTIVRFQNAQ